MSVLGKPDMTQPLEWVEPYEPGAKRAPAEIIGRGDKHHGKDIRLKILLDPENLPKGMKPGSIREEIHPDDLDLPTIHQRIRIYANVFEDTGYIGDSTQTRVHNVKALAKRDQKIAERRKAKAIREEQNTRETQAMEALPIWGTM